MQLATSSYLSVLNNRHPRYCSNGPKHPSVVPRPLLSLPRIPRSHPHFLHPKRDFILHANLTTASAVATSTMTSRWDAIGLTLLGAAGTSLGALLVVLHPKKTLDFKRLGLLQGLAAGLMLSLSFFDLIPESVESLGLGETQLWFFVGTIVFVAVSSLVPEASVESLIVPSSTSEQGDPSHPAHSKESERDKGDPKAIGGEASAGPNTGVTLRHQHRASDNNKKGASREGSASPSAAQIAQREAEKAKIARILFSGLITAVGLALHNAPEGMAVFMASHKSKATGVSVAIAIGLHNIPEGVAVACPVYFATKSKWMGFLVASISGLAEPAAAILTALLAPEVLPDNIVNRMLAAVAGIMAYLSLSELLPLSLTHAGQRNATASLFVGMALMAVTLQSANALMGGEH